MIFFSKNRHAMSIVELLVVISIIVILLGLSAPALVDLARGQGMRRAVNEVSAILEQARLEAMAGSTWTWVGFTEQMSDGSPELLAVVVASRDGSQNIATENLRQLQRPVRIKNVRVLSALTDWADAETMKPLTDSTFQFTQNVGGTDVQFSGSVLGFSPRGEATISPNSLPPWIEVGLREMRGTTEIPEKTASIRISGFSGQQSLDY